MGINTGEVVAGAVGDGYTVIGDTVNVAARLQTAGRPGSVTVGERTYRATREAIEYHAARAAAAEGQGRAGPGLGGRRRRRRHSRCAGGARREAPLVGRDDKLELLESLYERVASEDRPHLVTVIGQAGVGKSRLLLELQRAPLAREDEPAFREGRCLPYGSGIVYWALGEVIRTEAGIVDGDDSDVAWPQAVRDVEDLLGDDGDAGESSERRAALIGRLLGSRRRTAPPPSRPRTPSACARLLLGRSLADRGDGAPRGRWCSCSRTSTGPTTECST